jgi:CRP-like cAMP-binding protein
VHAAVRHCLGRVEVRQTSLRGREQVFHTEQPGVALGEAPLFDGGGYIASAVAVEPTRVLSLSRPRLIALCRTHPEVALALVETLARRVRRFAGIVSDLARSPRAVSDRGHGPGRWAPSPAHLAMARVEEPHAH